MREWENKLKENGMRQEEHEMKENGKLKGGTKILMQTTTQPT